MSEVAPPRYYDLVMKGGIAGGFVYPFNVSQAKEAARHMDAMLGETEYWHDLDGTLAKDAPNPPPTFASCRPSSPRARGLPDRQERCA